jgi:hypothetical protein
MFTFPSMLVAYPSSSKAITTTAAPYFYMILALFMKSSSPSFKEMEFTMALP